MSHDANTALLETAVELADEMDQRFEDPQYINLVAQFIRLGELEALQVTVRDMKSVILAADFKNRFGDLPEVTIW